MFLGSIILWILLLETTARAVQSNHETVTRGASPSCVDPPVRKEWRTLNSIEKQSYIEAVKCLTTKPAISGFSAAINRFDDHQAVHSDQTPTIHWVGHFILWHRYFVATYEKALRDECGYTGGQPYWNWSLDVSSVNDTNSTAVFSSPVFDPETGFGGNGPYVETNSTNNPFNLTSRTGGGCVMDGPFTQDQFTVNVPSPHCLTRDFIPPIMNGWAQQSLVDQVLATEDYTAFARAVENVPSFDQPNIHGGGHFGVGGALGTIGDANNSPGDPLFYLHHGNLDRIFSLWQSKDLPVRTNQVGGPIVPFDYGGQNVTLDFEINIGALAPNVTLKQVLEIQGSVLCYSYADLSQ
ncbi:hypothetical protein PFICI_03197 [Pestalotiopsis fici W106-1]|uniref:Tyrosinase copper-binding domain-containing protein n=1 Tax=Pestalotiopsis fici (strain W106-1 / CGMCC3.15140) TaxID=1229662 RepID=W3XI99_PESFW|nr:uncharacterized protein PFICI_03197 [Pestalotiopsis fici W106-1]ETS85172.1 hypothetical protein PFICI_03197 [Pestalotiopsis fici W106-1]